MKKHEDNAAKGDLFTTGAEEFDQIKEETSSAKGRVIDLVLPVVVLIISAIGAMIFTGFQGGATGVVDAFAGCDAETSLIFATMLTIIFMLLLYLPRKVITFRGFMDSFVEGFKLMIPACCNSDFCMVSERNGRMALGIADFVGGIVGANASASVAIPAIMFAVAIFLAFSTGTSWGTFAILVPIVVAMFSSANNMEMMVIAVSAVLAGAVCGDHVSPISGYDSYVFGGGTEQSYQSRIDADAVCDGCCNRLRSWLYYCRICKSMVDYVVA